MKKIILCSLTLLSIATGFSQEEKIDKNSIGLHFTGSQISTIGIFHETFYKDKKNINYSRIFEVNYAATTAKIESLEFTGSGIELRSSVRRYLKENTTNGFFTKSSLSYGNLKFNDSKDLGILSVNYKGTYSYFSFFAPEIGYDFMIGSKIRASLNAGTQWQIEIKGKDDVDNKDFDNWLYRFGARISYDF